MKPLASKGIPVAYTSLGILFLVSIFNYSDRYMIAILLPAIKKELALSDTEIGFLTGIAFTIFYVVMGIPIARLADRYSRKIVLSISLAVWSVMTAACSVVQTFAQLMFARIMVGVGEAGASPSSYSLISDYFPPDRRAGPMAVYLAGSPTGLLLGFMLGGWVVEHYSWRLALLVMGISGFLFSFVVIRYMREPARGTADGITEIQDVIPLREGMLELLSSRTFIHVAVGCALYNALAVAYINWLPSFFVRSHGLGLEKTGLLLAPVVGISQFVGVLAGGIVVDRLSSMNIKWGVWLPAMAVLAATPIFSIALVLESVWSTLICLFIPLMIGAMCVSPAFAITQRLVHIRMRAVASAILILIINLISGGLGPVLVGMVSDSLMPVVATESLRYALLLAAPLFGFWAALHYYLAERHIEREILAA